MSTSKTDLLQRLTPFRALSPREIKQVAKLCDVVSLEPGELLMKEGGSGWECFIIASGGADIVVGDAVVDTIGPDEFVGEMALLDRATRSASVVATSAVTAIVFGPREFAALLADHPPVNRHLTKHLTRRLRSADAGRREHA